MSSGILAPSPNTAVDTPLAIQIAAARNATAYRVCRHFEDNANYPKPKARVGAGFWCHSDTI